jgi:hypothetical protein
MNTELLKIETKMLSKVLTLRPQPSLDNCRKQTLDLKIRAIYVCAGQSFHMIILQSTISFLHH